nr:MAG TPA: hypothetical protein [Caudoviricetes sp.]
MTITHGHYIASIYWYSGRLASHPLFKGELNKRVGNVLGSIHGERITGSRHGERLERGRRCKGIANNPFLNEDSPFLGNAREAASPTRSNQDFKLLYITMEGLITGLDTAHEVALT